MRQELRGHCIVRCCFDPRPRQFHYLAEQGCVRSPMQLLCTPQELQAHYMHHLHSRPTPRHFHFPVKPMSDTSLSNLLCILQALPVANQRPKLRQCRRQVRPLKIRLKGRRRRTQQGGRDVDSLGTSGTRIEMAAKSGQTIYMDNETQPISGRFGQWFRIISLKPDLSGE